MTEKQRDLVAIVFDLHLSELRAALYQIVMGDDVATALDKARCQPSHYNKKEQRGLFK